MGFFDNLGKKASAAYDATAEKTSKIAKEAKLRMKMNENKSEINNIYKEIGKKVYEKHVANENIDIKTELEEECTKIDVLSAEIETCLKSILELKEKKQCEQCHTEIDLDDFHLYITGRDDWSYNGDFQYQAEDYLKAKKIIDFFNSTSKPNCIYQTAGVPDPNCINCFYVNSCWENRREQ